MVAGGSALERIATVHSLVRYPVKSMRGEMLTSTDVTLQGLPGDRRYAFVQAQSRSAFPWLTGRELPALLLYQPFHDEAGPRPRLLITTPDGATLPVESDELRHELEERSGRPLFLMRDHRGNYDIAQVSLIGLATTAQIAAESGTPHRPERFRANLYLETADGEPFAEERWVGRVLRVGDAARLAVTEPDERCAMITLDPQGGDARPEVLRSVARLHGNRAGVYGVVLTGGTVRTGDGVYVEEQ